MYINQTFELSMVLDSAKFHKVFDKACDRTDIMEKNEDEYVDHSLDSKGMTVVYRDSRYKKKVRVLANMAAVTESGKADPEKFIRKLDKRIREYFNFKFKLDDFILSGMTLAADINVGDNEMESAYLKVLQRIGKVKGFSSVNYDCFDNNTSFCLEGNSNGIEFLLYDLGSVLKSQLKKMHHDKKELKSVAKSLEGILRAEVRLTKPKAIRAYMSESNIYEQITGLPNNSRDIFLDVFAQIVPFGAFYKKDKAEELIHREVADNVMKRKMLRLLALIPEKKSLYLARKSMNCRNIEKVMDSFAKVNLSPVTISKRQDMKCLENLYVYLLNEE